MSPSRQSTTIAPRPSANSVIVNSTTSAATQPEPHEDPKSLNPRILRKREADRKCQRLIRERTKSRIAELEATVKEYERKDASGLSNLLKSLAEARNERDALSRKVKSVEGVLRDGRTITNDSAPAQENDHDFNSGPNSAESLVADIVPADDIYSRKHSLEDSAPIDTSPHSHSPSSSAIPLFQSEQLADNTLGASTDILLDHAVTDTIPAGNPIFPEPEEPCHCSTPSQPLQRNGYYNAWRYANEVLSSRFQWPVDYNTMLLDGFKDDIPIRAVVDGWDAVERRGSVHPSWQILKKIDQALFWRCEPLERLAVLYIMHMLFCSHSNTIEHAVSELPQYFLKGPSYSGPHSYAINYFIWPGIRQRFFQNQHRYCTNDFWSIFSRNLSVLWPYEFRDCYNRNTETGLFGITSLFLSRIQDLNAWTMGPEIFERWPEFRSDIPSLNSLPPTISAPSINRAIDRRNSKNAALSRVRRPSERLSVTSNPEQHACPNHVNAATSVMTHVDPSVFDPSQWSSLTQLQTSDLAYESLIPSPISGFPTHFT